VDSFRQHPKQETSSPKFQEAQRPKLAFQHKIIEQDESLEQLRQKVLNAVGMGEESAFSVRRDHNRLVLVFGECITFKKGEAKLLAGFEPNLGRIAHLIASREDYGVVVSGHTDDTPISNIRFPSNWELSASRAVNVAKFLIDHGVDPHRIVIQGYSEYRPVYKNISSENKQANRRVEITLEKNTI
jgi:chemotaxis protein MotB